MLRTLSYMEIYMKKFTWKFHPASLYLKPQARFVD
jgi:hypothetical protein